MQTKNQVKNRIIKTEMIDWQSLQFLQDDDFKEWTDEAKHSLKASIISNDFIKPFYVWTHPDTQAMYCLDGKHRVLAMQELITEGYNIPYQLPATFVDCGEDEARKMAGKLVLLYSSNYATVTVEGLKGFLDDFGLEWHDVKSEISLSDFSIHRFEQKADVWGLNEEQETEQAEDFTEQAEQLTEDKIIVKQGDLFRINQHEIYCMSCLDVERLKELFGDRRMDMLFTDPPYNLKANEFSNKGKAKHDDFAMGGGEMSDEEFIDFIDKFIQTACVLSKDGALHYIWIDWKHSTHIVLAGRNHYADMKKKRNNYTPKQMFIWYKDLMANGSFGRSSYEICLAFKFGTAKHTNHMELVDKVRSNVWNYPSATSRANPDRDILQDHPTPKTVAMLADAITDVTNEGDLVVDWFLGSGSTLIAADKVNRRCIGTEIMPKYVQLIIRRYIKHCQEAGKSIDFEHLNGELKLEDFQ